MLEKQVEAINEFAKTRFEKAQEAFRRVEDEVRRLIEESTERLEPGRERFEALLDRVRETREDFEDQVSDRITAVVNTLGLPTAAQLDELSERVDRLARKINKFATGKNGVAKSTTARKRKPAAEANV